ncbi:Rpn family recombination-promoting nuclease/putative transposase, partial [Bacteroides caecigallinarum]|uniref:Rpn family recombination-promoting nuclease/putative transposase n=2 Tax=Bacteroides caecigallinarum TaxID=1411144 RepID=UPI001F269584
GKEKYELLQPVYSLNLVNDVFEPEMESYYHDYRIVCMEKTDRVIDGLRFVFVELPKFKPQTFSQKKMHVLWLRYLTEIDENTREIPKELMDNPEINKAVTQIQESAFSDAQLLGYDDFWDAVRVEKTIVSDAERKGMAQGIEKGIAQGIEITEAKWREEKNAIVRNLKSLGLATEQIQAATGLTAEEIENL